MKLIYLSHWRFPSQKTHTAFALRTCEEFVRQGFEVELWVPRRHNPDDDGSDLLDRFGIQHRFIVKRLPVLDLMRYLGGVGFVAMVASYNLSVYAALRSEAECIVYAHDMRDVILPSRRGRPLFIEIHDFYESSFSFLNAAVLKRTAGLIVTNTLKLEHLAARYGFPRARMLHQQNAVDAALFNSPLSRDAARKTLGVPHDRTIALYAGHLYTWKGVETLVDAAASLEHTWVYLVGGTLQDRSRLQAHVQARGLARVEFVPHQPHERVPLYLRAADVLVLSNTAKEEASRTETSPVKLFEYLASGTPIVASDLPSIRDIVSEREVAFARPDDPQSFAQTIEQTLQDPGREARSAAGQALAQRNSWEARADAIARFIRAHIQYA